MIRMVVIMTVGGIIRLIVALHMETLIQILGTQPKKHVALVEEVALSLL